MFYLHLSNQTENLISHLAEVLSFGSERDPFAPEYFLIQSQGIERMLSQRLADVFGTWCNYEYMLPTRFFGRLGGQLGVEAGPDDYERERVCWHLEKILRTVEGDSFSSLIRYMADDPGGIKRYQLAQQLAYVFDQYQMMRLPMVDGWEQGKLSSSNVSEVYQMELWQLLLEAVGHARHRGVFLRDMITLLDRNEGVSTQIPKRLSVFGLHSMPPILLRSLEALAKHCDVHFYLLSPCGEYWLEQTAARTLLRKKIAAGGAGEVASEQQVGHPLLQSLGQQGRQFQQMLVEQIDFSNEFRSFVDPLKGDSPSLLHKIQSDLLQGEISPGDAVFPKDDSLVITSAHSPHREMMILRDRILHWLDADVSLQLKDIVVMTPDVHNYSHLIPAVFHDIPHSVADRNPASHNNYIAAFLQFLQLLSGRFGWSEVLDLLEREEVYLRFDIEEEDLAIIRHWVLSSGIRWGLSANKRLNMGLPEMEEGTWKCGLDRLLMGYSVNSAEVVDGIFPYQDIEGSMAEPLGGLSLFVEILESAQELSTGLYTLQQWADHFLKYAAKIFVSDKDDSLLQLFSLLEDLGGECGQFHSELLSFEVISARIKNGVTEQKSSSGFLRGQLTFCSMLPMRSIPFKKVCLLGVNDTVFPGSDTHLPFDLLGDTFEVGDRSRRSDDRYQFLEAILSARQSLYISYVGQSIHTNDTVPPSVLILELLEVTKVYGVYDLVDVHPLNGFSKEYFSPSGTLFSYDRMFADVAEAMQQRKSLPEAWWQGTLDTPAPDHLSVSRLLSFFRHPQKFFVQQMLGIRLDLGTLNNKESEPFLLDSLQNYLVDEELVAESVAHGENAQSLQKLQTTGNWPLGRPGTMRFEEKQEELQPFIERLREQETKKKLPGQLVEFTIDSTLLQGTLAGLYEDGLFFYRYAKVKAKDYLFTWIHHCLAAVCLGHPVDTRFLAKDTELLFPAGCGGADGLQQVIACCLLGQRMPSPLFLEPGRVFVEQILKNEQGKHADPMEKARANYTKALKEDREAEWDLLFGNQSAEMVLGESFATMCQEFLLPIWREVDETEN